MEVQIGGLRLRTRLDDIQRVGEDGPPVEAAPVSKASSAASASTPKAVKAAGLVTSPGMECDLRGQRAEEALTILENHIETAYAAGLPFVRVVHGKGTGKLRQVVREVLSSFAHVARWENGREGEGGRWGYGGSSAG